MLCCAVQAMHTRRLQQSCISSGTISRWSNLPAGHVTACCANAAAVASTETWQACQFRMPTNWLQVDGRLHNSYLRYGGGGQSAPAALLPQCSGTLFPLAWNAQEGPPKLPGSAAFGGKQWRELSGLQALAEYPCLSMKEAGVPEHFCQRFRPMAFSLYVQALKSGQGIILDLDFQDLMTEQEMRSLVGAAAVRLCSQLQGGGASPSLFYQLQCELWRAACPLAWIALWRMYYHGCWCG